MKFRSIRTPLLALVVLASLGLLGLAGFATWTIKGNELTAKIDMTKSADTIALSVAKEFDDRSSKGEMDVETAKTMAKNAIRAMRYGDDDYMFIYDDKGLNIVHGSKKDREGKNFIDTKDANGYAYLPDMIKLAKAGGGHVFYTFPKPGANVGLPKVSTVVYYEPWNWVIGTGVYIDDVDAGFRRNITEFVLLFAVVLGVIGGLAILLARSISRPVAELAVATEHIGKGNYALRVPATNRRDEIGVLAVAVETLKNEAHAAETLRQEQATMKRQAEEERTRSMQVLSDHFEANVMSAVNAISTRVDIADQAAGALASSANKVRDEATEVASAAEQVDANIQTISAATEQLSASVAEIASQITQSNTVTHEVVQKTEETDQMVKELAESVIKISGVVDLINDIASQTNLLALNATIEAARAGNAGKGFAVVANEVKNLANQTARATDEIVGQIETVKSATDRSVDALRRVISVIGTVMEISESIAAAVEEQTVATREISGTLHQAATGTKMVANFIVDMADMTKQVDDKARTVAETSSELKTQAQNLNAEIGGFLRVLKK